MAWQNFALEAGKMAAGAAIPAAIHHIFGKESEESILRKDLLKKQVEGTDRLARLARGDFTQGESRAYTRGVRQAVQPSLAARGLSRSPVAASAISDASAAQLRNVQIQAGTAAFSNRHSLLGNLDAGDAAFGALAGITKSLGRMGSIDSLIKSAVIALDRMGKDGYENGYTQEPFAADLQDISERELNLGSDGGTVPPRDIRDSERYKTYISSLWD